MRQEWPNVLPEHESIWRALDEARPEPLAPEASDRIRRSLDAVARTLQERRVRMLGTSKVAAAAALAALVVGGFVGFGVGSSGMTAPETAAGPAAAEGGAGAQYLLLVHETEATERAVREVGMEAIVAEYAEWAGDLGRRGKLVSAEKLSDITEWVGADASRASPVSGFFLIRADSREEALAIARQSPHTRYGGVVEVRPIDPTGE